MAVEHESTSELIYILLLITSMHFNLINGFNIDICDEIYLQKMFRVLFTRWKKIFFFITQKKNWKNWL